MSIRVAVRGLAALSVFLLAAFGNSGAARAQWQINVAAIDPGTALRAQPEPDLFGLESVAVARGEILTKWNRVAAEIAADRDVLRRCREAAATCPASAQKLLAVIAEGQAREGRARIGTINRSINLAIKPMSDLAQWGVIDRWSAPLETLSSGRGDCEDYAIAKYVALGEAGFSEDKLRLVIVRDLGLGEDHAILAVRDSEKWLLLDNRRLVLVEDGELQRVEPLFALNRDGVREFTPSALADERTAAATVPSSLAETAQ
ncbi:MAG TPA: transglutaminase-like cysteine peptidase [Xanthobacteraceae bacterium]|jgi:predicted transglutaminase-like cysteine proteinase|nr:transglutaminase-like cysteine peptidase [Xanthobacteraceae bacterium]